MTAANHATVKALKRVQNVARTRLADEPPGMTRFPPDAGSTSITYGRSVVEAVDAAAEQLIADLSFEHLDPPEDELWQFVDQCQASRQTDHVHEFIAVHACRPFTALCRVEVDYLEVDQPVEIFGIRLTPVNVMPTIRLRAPNLGSHSGCMAEVEVTGTNPDRMLERARSQVQRSLRVLRVALLDRHSARPVQLRFRVGAVAEMDTGAGEWRAMDSGASQLKVNRSAVDVLRYRSIAGLADKPTSDIERKANVALGWIERAAFTDDPLVAMLYQFFALEALLGEKSSKRKGEQLAFRRATLSNLVTGGFRHPATALSLYEEVRNHAVHGESMPEVDWPDVQRLASDVRAALDEYLTFARSEGLTRRSKLTRALDEHPDRQQLVDWLRESGGPRWERFVAEQTTTGEADGLSC